MNEQREARTKQQIAVREVTHMQTEAWRREKLESIEAAKTA